MNRDRDSQMDNLLKDITNLLQELVSKITSLIFLLLQEWREGRKKIIYLEEKVANVEDLALEIQRCSDRVKAVESLPMWDGENIISHADYHDMSEET